jgi:hypothetical protein
MLLEDGVYFMEVDSNGVMYLGSDNLGGILTSTDYTTFTPQGPFLNRNTSQIPTTLRAVSGSTLVGTDSLNIYTYVYSEGILTRTLLPCSYDIVITNILDVISFGSVYVASSDSKLLLSTYNSAIAGFYSFTVTGDVTSLEPLTDSGINIIDSTNNNGSFSISSFTVIGGDSTLYLYPTDTPLVLSPVDGVIEGVFNPSVPYLITHNLNTTWPTVSVLAKDTTGYTDDLWHILSNYGDVPIVDENTINVIHVMSKSNQHYYFKITK